MKRGGCPGPLPSMLEFQTIFGCYSACRGCFDRVSWFFRHTSDWMETENVYMLGEAALDQNRTSLEHYNGRALFIAKSHKSPDASPIYKSREWLA